jgi:sterol desaturase/sphingolipid hydroxylase (fatty acid hydroxylase superfamily)
MESSSLILYAVPVFVACILLEVLVGRAGKHVRYQGRDTAASLTMGLGSVLISAATGSLVASCFAIAHRLAAFEIGHAWWAWVLCFFAEDLAYYWFHRVSHERRWFWASHVVHHSSQHYNLSTALRQTWTGKITFGFVFWLPLLLLGFAPEMVLTFTAISLLYQFWIHTEAIDRLGPLERILNTPSHHRVHHAVNPRYLDANYGGVLIVWDRLFGSFVAELGSDPPRYGIVKNIDTFNPLRIAFHEWCAIARDLRSARGRREWLGYLFGPPGWSPDGSRDTSATIKARWRSTLAKEPAGQRASDLAVAA